VIVLQDFMDSIVKLVQLLDSGILSKTLVSVLLQEQYGIQQIKLVIVHLDYLVYNV
jgi:hypothetical protein